MARVLGTPGVDYAISHEFKICIFLFNLGTMTYNESSKTDDQDTCGRASSKKKAQHCKITQNTLPAKVQEEKGSFCSKLKFEIQVKWI